MEFTHHVKLINWTPDNRKIFSSNKKYKQENLNFLFAKFASLGIIQKTFNINAEAIIRFKLNNNYCILFNVKNF